MAYSILMLRPLSWLYGPLCALIAFVLFGIYFVFCPCRIIFWGRNQYVHCHNIGPHILIFFFATVNRESMLVMIQYCLFNLNWLPEWENGNNIVLDINYFCCWFHLIWKYCMYVNKIKIICRKYMSVRVDSYASRCFAMQDGRHFQYRIFMNENTIVSILISLKFIVQGLNQCQASISLISSWRRKATDKLSS